MPHGASQTIHDSLPKPCSDLQRAPPYNACASRSRDFASKYALACEIWTPASSIETSRQYRLSSVRGFGEEPSPRRCLRQVPGRYDQGLFAFGPDPMQICICALPTMRQERAQHRPWAAAQGRPHSTLNERWLINWPVGVSRSTVHCPRESSGKFCLRLKVRKPSSRPPLIVAGMVSSNSSW